MYSQFLALPMCTNVLLVCALLWIFFVQICWLFSVVLGLISFRWKQKKNKQFIILVFIVISYNYRCAAKHQSLTQRRYRIKWNCCLWNLVFYILFISPLTSAYLKWTREKKVNGFGYEEEKKQTILILPYKLPTYRVRQFY